MSSANAENLKIGPPLSGSFECRGPPPLDFDKYPLVMQNREGHKADQNVSHGIKH